MNIPGDEKFGDTSVALGNLSLRSPIIAASGTYGYGTEFEGFANFDCVGAITLKAVSLEERKGNPYPRIVETPSGILNSIGLENPGLDIFIGEKLPEAAALGVPLIANLVGDRIEDYVELAEALYERKELSALEINASCPNVTHGYMAFSVDVGILSELTERVRKVTKKPLIVKLSPNVTDIIPLAKAAADSGADILNIANTYLGMAIDIETRKSRLCRDYAGLSGRAIRPITLRLVHQAACSAKIPIIGTGGIYDSTDAIEFLIAGATAVGLGTVNLIFPDRACEILAGIKSYLKEKKVTLKELIGSYIPSS